MTRRLFLFLFLLPPLARAQDAPVCVMPHGDRTPSALVGVKIYYGDDTVIRIRAADLATGWLLARSDGVQVVRLYYDRYYRIWDPVEQKPTLRRFAETIQGHDFYYWSPTKGFGNTDVAAEVPLDVAAVKIGTLLPDAEFLRIYNKAHQDYEW